MPLELTASTQERIKAKRPSCRIDYLTTIGFAKLTALQFPISMVSSTSAFAIKNRQRAVFDTILRSSQPDKNATQWKVLVCDSQAFDSLSCLFQPSQLRRYGVTLQAIIDKPRGPVPDVPVIYIISPSPENIAWLLKDLASDSPLYTTATVCFTTFISRPLLTALAAQLSVPAPISSMRDLYADFVSFEQNMFSLHIKSSYISMKTIKDEVSGKLFVDLIVSRLFSALLTLGVIPIIRSQRGGAAETVSRALDKRLRDNLELFQAPSFSTRPISFRRPLLLMLDRDFDFNAMLHHTWTYQALIHDCLHLRLNKVTLEVLDNNAEVKKVKKTYTLNKDSDFFWDENAFSPFPNVAEAIDVALKKYRAEVDEINRNAGEGPASEKGTVETAQLAAAIAALPELSKRKELIDIHTNIATALLNHINKRTLDSFFELESQLMANYNRPSTYLSADEYKATVVELLKGAKESEMGGTRGTGTAADRLRLFLIYYNVFGAQLPEKSVSEFRGILQKIGADTSAIDYVRKLKGFRHDLVTSDPSSVKGALNTAKLKGIMTNMMNRGYRSFASLAQNAKKLVVEEKKSSAVARTLELFMSEQSRSRYGVLANTILDGYLLFDPKVIEIPTSNLNRAHSLESGLRKEGEETLTSKQKMQRMVFSDAIVFTVGGGNYVEYDNCVEMVKAISSASSKKNILYGTTELLTSEEFLGQLAAVAAKSR